VPSPADVRRFWFGQPDPTQPPTVSPGRWWTSDPDFDAQIQQQFGDLMDQALAGRLEDWTTTPEDTLALILVLDQFPRNVFRGTAKAFAGDERARELARSLDGGPESWHLHCRTFALLPFEHSESADDQALSVARFKALAKGQDEAQMLVDYAVKHRDIVARFGRFPHRNRALGRTSTAKERAFLDNGGPSFGQG
jgi:uncharacterized protein (DUF924 family)